MEEMPEAKFGLPDIISIGMGVVTFIFTALAAPDQTWITEDPSTLLVIRMILAVILGIAIWFVGFKLLVPTDKELVDLGLKRKIQGDTQDIRNDAQNIQTIGLRFPARYINLSDKTVQLGQMIWRVMDNLGDPDLSILTKIDGKINRFVELLTTFETYASGRRRTTQAKYDLLVSEFKQALDITYTAMDNMELNLSDPNLSRATVLANTLADLAAMDGLTGTRTAREAKDRIKQTEKETEL